MPSPRIYLITGAGRGIGLALVEEIASKHADAIVYAGARDIAHADQLHKLTLQYPGRIEIFRYFSGDVGGNHAVADQIMRRHGHVDIVIANAATSNYIGPIFETPVDQLQEHFKINVAGVLVLFQAMYPLLKRSESPKFIPISSAAASLTAYMDIAIEYTCYGVSKAALNWLARKIHFENQWLVCFPLSPGVVNTDMLKQSITMDASGQLAELRNTQGITIDTSATGIIAIIDEATRERYSGEFMNYDGTIIPW